MGNRFVVALMNQNHYRGICGTVINGMGFSSFLSNQLSKTKKRDMGKNCLLTFARPSRLYGTIFV